MTACRAGLVVLLLLVGSCDGGVPTLDETLLEVTLEAPALAGTERIVRVAVTLETPLGRMAESRDYQVDGAALPGTLLARLPAFVVGELRVSALARDASGNELASGATTVRIVPLTLNRCTVLLAALDLDAGPDVPPDSGDGPPAVDLGDAGADRPVPDALDLADGAPDGLDLLGDRPDRVDDRPDLPLVTPISCAEVRQVDPGAGDGTYTLYVRGDPALSWPAYCHDMAGSPREYLTLVETGPGRNFGQYTVGGLATGTDVRTTYTRIRLDPRSLLVDIFDQTFATSTGQAEFFGAITRQPYATASDCSGPGQMTGLANIDLRATPFAVRPHEFFAIGAAEGPGTAVYGAAGQVVDLSGGGSCGSTMPRPGTTTDTRVVATAFLLSLVHGPLPESCADLKAALPSAGDGTQRLFHGRDPGRPFTVTCTGMATASPSEYLPLVQVGSGRNESHYASGGGAVGTSVTTRFSQVRLDPVALRVDVGDRTFGTASGTLVVGGRTLTSLPYGVAADCAGAGSRTGRGNVDLRGSPFGVAQGAFITGGSQAAGSSTYSAAGQVVDLTGGGSCGYEFTAPDDVDPFAISSAFRLPLRYLRAPRTCAEVRAVDPTAPDGEYSLHVDGDPARPWTAYCHDMVGTPREYLSLVMSGPGLNDSRFPAGGVASGSDLVTLYERLRIDPGTLRVDVADARFAISTGSISLAGRTIGVLPFATAISCDPTGALTARTEITFVGTPFDVVSGELVVQGTGSAGYSDQGAVGTVFGDCGSVSPAPAGQDPLDLMEGQSFLLQLTYLAP